MVPECVWPSRGPKASCRGFTSAYRLSRCDPGGPVFADYDKATNGGGFGFVYNITDKFGIFQQTGFLGGAKDELSGLTMRMITEFQGMQVTKRAKAIDFYAKGGVGFSRYVIENSGVWYSLAFQYGGGAEINIGRGLYLVLEATGLSMGVPELYYTDDRSRWCNTLMITPGIAIRF